MLQEGYGIGIIQKLKALHKMYHLYMLKCKRYGLYSSKVSYYIGITTNWERRWKLHKEGKAAKFTRSFIPLTGLVLEILPNRSKALKRELELKRLKHLQRESLWLTTLFSDRLKRMQNGELT